MTKKTPTHHTIDEGRGVRRDEAIEWLAYRYPLSSLEDMFEQGEAGPFHGFYFLKKEYRTTTPNTVPA